MLRSLTFGTWLLRGRLNLHGTCLNLHAEVLPFRVSAPVAAPLPIQISMACESNQVSQQSSQPAIKSASNQVSEHLNR